MNSFLSISHKEDMAENIISKSQEQVKTTQEVVQQDQRTSPKYTPERILDLQPNEVFVFGSNLEGLHIGGAARTALNHFGAKWGQGVGIQGQSYAIPTMQGGVYTIKPYVDEFIEYAKTHTNQLFYVTRIGCGIARFEDEQIAPLFANAINLANVILPYSFVKYLTDNEK